MFEGILLAKQGVPETDARVHFKCVTFTSISLLWN